ncbi:MAG: PilZ domain-containing protein [Proteobacteria bacterium]|nr:PilZ domain-containing protein [Pseudomonadota bacterium]
MPNYQVKLSERRTDERKRLTGLMPGRFQVDGADVSARPIDISEHGLGILVAKKFKVGTTAALVLKDREIAFEIKWAEPDFGKQDLIRYGLVCTNEKINVEQLFFDTGCIR